MRIPLVNALAFIMPAYDLNSDVTMVPTIELFAVEYQVWYWDCDTQSWEMSDQFFEDRKEATVYAKKLHEELKDDYGITED